MVAKTYTLMAEDNLSTTCTKDDIVEYLIGWPMQICNFSEHPSDEELESHDYSWDTLLKTYLEWAQIDYDNAKVEKLGEKIIAEKLVELKKCKAELAQAHHYECLIADELAREGESMLRVDPVRTENPVYPIITKASVWRWIKSNPDLVETNSSEKIATQPSGALSQQEVQKLCTTLGELVNKIANTDKKTYQHKDGRPKIDTIAKRIEHAANKFSVDMGGQKTSTVRTRINKVIDINKGKKAALALNATQTKSLLITFAFLIEEFGRIKFGDCNIPEIATDLANDLSGQTKSDIELRINRAIMARKNRDKRQP